VALVAWLRLCDASEIDVTIRDISRGGIAVHCDGKAECGSEMTLVFCQEASSLEYVDRALDHIAGVPQARAA
jgi:hypothetical protein